MARGRSEDVEASERRRVSWGRMLHRAWRPMGMTLALTLRKVGALGEKGQQLT